MQMLSFLVRRILLAIPTLIGVAVVTFFLIRVVPGDPVVVKLRADGTTERMLTLPLAGVAPPVLGAELAEGRAAFLSADGVLSVVGLADRALVLDGSRPLLADVPVAP